MQKLIKRITLTRVVNLIIILIVLGSIVKMKFWREPDKVICWDIISYYAYLPATFIYGDVTLSFMDKSTEDFSNKFWPGKTPIGKNAIKTSMGLSFLYAPFFFTGHIAAHVFGYDTGGFSSPYKFALLLSSLFYLAVGLFFLRKILEKYFTKGVTAMTLLAVALGTNLFCYATIEATMSHVYNFSLLAVFLYLVIKWFEKPAVKNTIFIGLLSGLIVLIRPTNVIILLFLLLWGVTSWKSFRERIKFFFKSYQLILIMLGCFIMIWIPQMIYWKAVSGSWLYFSYGEDERFFFTNPQIYRGLFGYRKGWLVYTPIMIFALAGIPMLFRKYKEFFWPTLIFTVLNIYILLSWWSWWYGGGFGLRAFIDSYCVLAFPLAVFIKWCYEKMVETQVFITAILIVLIGFNLFQTRQYYYGSIHWDSMSKEAYWASFGKKFPPANFQYLLEHPDYDKAKQGIYAVTKEKPVNIDLNNYVLEGEIICDAETPTKDSLYFTAKTGKYLFANGKNQSDEKAHSGKYSVKLTKKNPFGMTLTIDSVKTNDYYKVSVWRFGDNEESFIVAADETAKEFYKTQNYAEKENDDGWEFLELEFIIPKEIENKFIKVYVWNKSSETVYFDDLIIMKQNIKNP